MVAEIHRVRCWFVYPSILAEIHYANPSENNLPFLCREPERFAGDAIVEILRRKNLGSRDGYPEIGKLTAAAAMIGDDEIGKKSNPNLTEPQTRSDVDNKSADARRVVKKVMDERIVRQALVEEEEEELRLPEEADRRTVKKKRSAGPKVQASDQDQMKEMTSTPVEDPCADTDKTHCKSSTV
eukprot:g18483.t1